MSALHSAFHSLALFESLSSGQLAPLHQFQGKQVLKEKEYDAHESIRVLEMKERSAHPPISTKKRTEPYFIYAFALFFFNAFLSAHWRNLQCERKRGVVKSIKQIKGTWRSLESWSYDGGDMELVIVGWTRHVPSFRISTCWAFRRAIIINNYNSK